MKKIQRLSCILAVITLLFPMFFGASTASAIKVIPKSKYKKVAMWKNPQYMTQGGVVTKDYYVFTNCGKKFSSKTKEHHCTKPESSFLYVVNRNTCKSTKTKFNFGYISGINNQPNTNKIGFLSGGTVVGCMKISNGVAKKTNKKECHATKFAPLNPQQGTTALFNSYRFKTAGYGGTDTKIAVFNMKSNSPLATFKTEEKLNEPEGISVDPVTGEVFITFQKGHKNSDTYFLKIDSSVFKKWTGKSGTSNYPICKYGKPVGGNPSNPVPDNPGSDNPGSDDSGSDDSHHGGRPSSEPAPTPHYDGSVDTTFFGNLKDDGKGCGIYSIVAFIIDILTWGIGIAAVIGIAISGIYYLTAKGNQEQAAKSKRRIYEIIIGLAAYAVLYTALNFLLPGGNFNTSGKCASTTSSSNYGTNNPWSDGGSSSSSGSTSSSSDSGSSSSTSTDSTITGTKEYTKTIASKPFKLKLTAPSNVAFKSSNKRVAVVTSDGTVYPNDVGEAIITASSGSNTFKIKVKIGVRTSKPTIGQALTSHTSQAKQVKTGKWYKNNNYANWDHVFRFKDPVKAEIAADAMIATCNNNNIGYNNSNNKINTFTNALIQANYNPSKITKKVYTSCDRAVLAAVLVAGYHRNQKGWATSGYGGGGAPGVYKKLKNDSGHFYTISDSSYTKHWNKLRRGDILVDHIGGNGHRHVIMVVK